MDESRSEDTLILYAFTPGVTKFPPVYKALRDFFNKKKEIDPSDRFNLILFQKNAPYYLEDFTLNPEHILNALKSLKKKIVKANLGGGIFVAVTFIIDVFKKIGEKCFRLIILTDEGSFAVAKQHVLVLENLIEQVKDMPFFIDVVLITKKETSKNLALKKLANQCGGDIHDIYSVDYLPMVLSTLSAKKILIEGLKEERKAFKIPEDHHPFYENLAQDPDKIEKEETCTICFQKDNTRLGRCPSCQSIVHKSCWSQWAKTSHIGMLNVFRCHNCYNLLKLDKNFVWMVQSGKMPSIEEIEVKVLDLQTYLEGLETEEGPKIIEVEEQLLFIADEYEDFD